MRKLRLHWLVEYSTRKTLSIPLRNPNEAFRYVRGSLRFETLETRQVCAAPQPVANFDPCVDVRLQSASVVSTANNSLDTSKSNSSSSQSNATGLHLTPTSPPPPAGGSWSLLASTPPSAISTMMLLTDGSVIAQDAGVTKDFFKLTPDSAGNYSNGTWATLAPMSLERLYVGSNILPSGKMFVLGGEYSGPDGAGNWINSGEIYDPVSNTWSAIPNFPQSQFGDDPTIVLPNGQILAGYLSGTDTYLYNPATNTWAATGRKLHGDPSDEETWVMLPDGSVLTVDVFVNNHAQRYIPGTGTWVDAGTVPVILTGSSFGFEMGPATLLPDGRVLQIGATNQTAIYTPSTNTWVAGPSLPATLGADDAPGVMLPNGHFLFAVDTSSPKFTKPTRLFDFDPTTNNVSNITSTLPTALVNQLNGPAFIYRFLMLPNGHALFSGFSNQVWEYTPSGSPNASWAPTVSNIAYNGPGKYTLTGTQLTGISEGASYGDDAEMSTNYPIVKLTNSTGVVKYARTFNWTPGVATGSASVTTQFQMPSGFGPGVYTLNVIANGIASTDQVFSTTQLAIAATDATKNEGNSGTTAFTFTVTRSGDITAESTVAYSVLGSGAHPADVDDFGGAFPSGTASFVSGASTTTITINVSGDSVAEADEGFQLTLSAPTGAAITTSTASGSIIDDDTNQPPTGLTLAPNSASLAENLDTSTTIDLSTINIIDDGLGSNILSLTGPDAASFVIAGTKLQLASGVALDYETKNNYQVTVNVDDPTVGTTPDQTANFVSNVTNVNESPTLTASVSQVTGAVLSQLTNSGTWSDPEADVVTLSASLGTVVKNANGTWDWSFKPSAALSNQSVTITATDADGLTTDVSFTINALVAVSNRQVYYKGSSYANSSIQAALDTAKVIAQSGSTAQTLSYANLINTTRGINGIVLDIAGLAATSLSATDFSFRMSPTGLFNEAANPPSNWTAAPDPITVAVTPGNATTAARVRLEWADSLIANRWLQVRVLANANTGLIDAKTFYLGHLQGEVNGTIAAGGFLVTTQDQTGVLPLGTANVSSVRDLDKNGFVTTQDIAAVRTSISAGRTLRVITIPASGSGAEGEANSRRPASEQLIMPSSLRGTTDDSHAIITAEPSSNMTRTSPGNRNSIIPNSLKITSREVYGPVAPQWVERQSLHATLIDFVFASTTEDFQEHVVAISPPELALLTACDGQEIAEPHG